METQEYHRLRAVEDEHWWFRSLNELVEESLSTRLTSAEPSILDAGCGTGGLLARLSRIGCVEGIDASPVAVELARARGLGGVRQDDLNAPTLAPAAYNAITSLDVLYHAGVDDDAAVLRRLQEALRPGGVLFLHLPAFEALRSRHDLRVHTRRRYRLADVRQMLAAAGYVVEHGSYRMMLLAPALLLARVSSALGSFAGAAPASDVRRAPAWLNRLLLAVCRLENKLSRRVSLPFGVSLYVIARKAPGHGAASS